ncbi:MAG: hypothetical protein II899_08150 [Bacteroidales bacterium]|nr:hypothetical protein [Bacteroidales bacterium]
MKKIVCIYPEDPTTAFLLPLYEHICSNMQAIGIHNDTTEEDDSLDKLYAEIKDARSVVFLGHGTSQVLYGSNCANVVFEKNNSDLLCNKRLLLLSCNSDQFIKNHKLTDAIGFGFLPTSLDDARQTRTIHSIAIEDLEKKDVECYNVSLVNALIHSLSETTLSDFHLFKERLRFSISREIVECLLNKEAPNYRTVADELYYVYKDMIVS